MGFRTFQPQRGQSTKLTVRESLKECWKTEPREWEITACFLEKGAWNVLPHGGGSRA